MRSERRQHGTGRCCKLCWFTGKWDPLSPRKDSPLQSKHQQFQSPPAIAEDSDESPLPAMEPSYSASLNSSSSKQVVVRRGLEGSVGIKLRLTHSSSCLNALSAEWLCSCLNKQSWRAFVQRTELACVCACELAIIKHVHVRLCMFVFAFLVQMARVLKRGS